MHSSSHHPTTLLVALPTHKTPRSTPSWWPTRTGGTWVRPLCRKPAPRGAASPSAAAPSCLRTRGGLERNPTDNPTSRPEGPPQVLFSRRTSTTRQIRRLLLVGSALNKGAGPVAGAPPGKRQRAPPHSRAPDPKRRTRRPAHHKPAVPPKEDSHCAHPYHLFWLQRANQQRLSDQGKSDNYFGKTSLAFFDVLGSPHSRLDRCQDPAINMLILPRSEATEAHGSALPRLQVAPTRRARTR